MDMRSYQETLRRLAPVCQYFAHYVTRERCRRLHICGIVPKSWLLSHWVTDTLQRLEPVESLRTYVKECAIQEWDDFLERSEVVTQFVKSFLPQFLPLMSSLVNLRILTLRITPISYFLLQAVGRLQGLEELVIYGCPIRGLGGDHPEEPIFGVNETPFPALRQLNIEKERSLDIHTVFKDAFCTLVGATTLRSLVISSAWSHFLLPHISQHLVSLSGDFSSVPFDRFLQFLKTRISLQHLTICSDTAPWFPDYEDEDGNLLPFPPFHLDKDVLPDLRSFSGPSGMAPELIRGRPVTRLAMGCNLPRQFFDIPLTSLYGLTVFPHTHWANYRWEDHMAYDEVWHDLKTIGGDILELFVRVGDDSLSLISPCFPNLVHLEIELWDRVFVSHSCTPVMYTEITCYRKKGLT